MLVVPARGAGQEVSGESRRGRRRGGPILSPGGLGRGEQGGAQGEQDLRSLAAWHCQQEPGPSGPWASAEDPGWAAGQPDACRSPSCRGRKAMTVRSARASVRGRCWDRGLSVRARVRRGGVG